MKSKYGNQPVHCDVGGKLCKFRSKAEYRYASYLEFLKLNGDIYDWEYEPQFFEFPIKHGITRYKPDFKILEKIGVDPSGLTEVRRSWVEVKGYMDSASKTKLARFKRYYPDEKLVLVDSRWFRSNTKKLKGLVKGWS